MKYLSLGFFLIVFTPTLVKADLGNCVVYHAKFYLKDGTAFNGCFEVMGYDAAVPNFNPSTPAKEKNTHVFDQFKAKQRMFGRQYQGFNQPENTFGKIAVFHGFHYATPKSRSKKYRSNLDYFTLNPLAFVAPEEVEFLDSTDIIKLVFINAEFSKRDWVEVALKTALPGMMDSVINKRYWNMTNIHQAYQSDPDSSKFAPENATILFFNYNPNVNSAELKRLIKLKPYVVGEGKAVNEIRKKYNLPKNAAFSVKQNWLLNRQLSLQWDDYCKWFWDRGILVVAQHGTC